MPWAFAYNISGLKRFRVALRKSLGSGWEGEYHAHTILGRVSSLPQGDTASPHRGSKFPATYKMRGRIFGLIASMKLLLESKRWTILEYNYRWQK